MSEETVVRELDSTGTQVNAEANAKAEPAGDPQATAEQGEREQGQKSGWQRAKEARKRAEDERDHWREIAMRIAPKPEPEAIAAPAKAKPSWSEYESSGKQEQYFEDLADWKAEQKLAAYKSEQQAEAKKRETQTETAKQADRWKQASDDFREEHSDFDEVIAQGNPSDLLSSLVARNKDAVRLAYHLANNPELESQLSRMTDPVDVAQELGLIRAQFAQPSQAAEETPEPPISKAPKPITPVSKSSPSKSPDIHDEKLPYEEYVKLRSAQTQRK